MAEDLAMLERAEQRIVDVVGLASQVVEQLTSGNADEAEALSSKLLDAVQDSQCVLLQMAGKYADPVPYVNNDYAEKLKAVAATKPQPHDGDAPG